MRKLLPIVLLAALLGLGATPVVRYDAQINSLGYNVGGTPVVDSARAATVSALVSTGNITSTGGISGTTGTFSGNVRIGTTAPTYPLDINLNVDAGTVSTAGEGNLKVNISGEALQIGKTATLTNAVIANSSAKDTIFTFWVSGTNTERMRLTSTGDVLLGTTTAPSTGSGKVMVFGDNAADPTMGASTVGLWNNGGTLKTSGAITSTGGISGTTGTFSGLVTVTKAAGEFIKLYNAANSQNWAFNVDSGGFYVKDVVNTTYPLQILKGAPSGSQVINADGSISLAGTINPRKGFYSGYTSGSGENNSAPWYPVAKIDLTGQYEGAAGDVEIRNANENSGGYLSGCRVTFGLKQQNAMGGASIATLLIREAWGGYNAGANIRVVQTENSATHSIAVLYAKQSYTYESLRSTILNNMSSALDSYQNAAGVADLPSGVGLGIVSPTWDAVALGAISGTTITASGASGSIVLSGAPTAPYISMAETANRDYRQRVQGGLWYLGDTTTGDYLKIDGGGGSLDVLIGALKMGGQAVISAARSLANLVNAEFSGYVNADQLRTNGTARIDNAGNAVNIASLTAGNESFTYDEGTDSIQIDGCNASFTPTMSYVRVGKKVTLQLPLGSTCTSNTASFQTPTGELQTDLRPANQIAVPVVMVDGGTNKIGKAIIYSTGRITFRPGAPDDNWATSGTKGFPDGAAFSYALN